MLFFGREREREIITANLLASRLTVLYGPSGVGKSSVLRAGVVRQLLSSTGEMASRVGRVSSRSWSASGRRRSLAELRAAVEAELRGAGIAADARRRPRGR